VFGIGREYNRFKEKKEKEGGRGGWHGRVFGVLGSFIF
jgi:hypothetical protein